MHRSSPAQVADTRYVARRVVAVVPAVYCPDPMPKATVEGWQERRKRRLLALSLTSRCGRCGFMVTGSLATTKPLFEAHECAQLVTGQAGSTTSTV